jgi:opacity protein-like surface antigen
MLTRRARLVALLGAVVAAPVAIAWAGGQSEESHVSARRAVVWAVGDGGNASAVAKRVARRIARTRPDRLLYLGDVYDWEDAAGFARQYGSVYGRLARVTAPTPGNHDTPTRDGYDPYWRRVKGKTPPSYYSFRLAGWRILSLNSEVSHGPGSAQVRWLSAQVSRPGTCRIAFWHRPRYSAGTHHGDQDDMAAVWNALRGRASIVLAGHEHDMQRFKPIDGITELVSGAGGKGLYDVDRGDRRLAFANDSEHGALRLDLRSGRARLRFVSAGGRTLDSSSVSCRR